MNGDIKYMGIMFVEPYDVSNWCFREQVDMRFRGAFLLLFVLGTFRGEMSK